MEPCSACGEKCTSHTGSGAEKQCNNTTEPVSFAILWHPVNRNTHIKRENKLQPFDRGGKSQRAEVFGQLKKVREL